MPQLGHELCPQVTYLDFRNAQSRCGAKLSVLSINAFVSNKQVVTCAFAQAAMPKVLPTAFLTESCYAKCLSGLGKERWKMTTLDNINKKGTPTLHLIS